MRNKHTHTKKQRFDRPWSWWNACVRCRLVFVRLLHLMEDNHVKFTLMTSFKHKKGNIAFCVFKRSHQWYIIFSTCMHGWLPSNDFYLGDCVSWQKYQIEKCKRTPHENLPWSERLWCQIIVSLFCLPPRETGLWPSKNREHILATHTHLRARRWWQHSRPPVLFFQTYW